MTIRAILTATALLALAACTDREPPTAAAPSTATAALAPLVVQNLSDAGPGSLREAIDLAATGQVVTFDPSLAGGTVALTQELTIWKSLTIAAPGAGIVLSGGDLVRPLRIGPVYEVVLDNLTIRDGTADNSPHYNGDGGAIHSFANLTLRDVTLEGNVAGRFGGAILQAGNTLTIVGSTIADNRAGPPGTGQGSGGGLHAIDATVAVVNSTVSGNSAGAGGGGILSEKTDMTLVHTTVANNGSNAGGGIMALGFAPSSLTLVNSLVAGNVASAAAYGPDIVVPTGSPVALAASHSLVGTVEGYGITSGSGALVGVDARFVLDGFGRPLLADNGGGRRTHLLEPGSPAIDAAGATACTDAPVSGIDQRGVTRPQGAACDMGAVEIVAAPPRAVIGTLVIDDAATVNRTSGAAVVSGTIACTTPGPVTLDVTLAQERKDRRLSYVVTGSTTLRLDCTSAARPWAAAVAGGNGMFVTGGARAEAGDGVAVTGQAVKLSWGK